MGYEDGLLTHLQSEFSQKIIDVHDSLRKSFAQEIPVVPAEVKNKSEDIAGSLENHVVTSIPTSGLFGMSVLHLKVILKQTRCGLTANSRRHPTRLAHGFLFVEVGAHPNRFVLRRALERPHIPYKQRRKCCVRISME